MTKPFDVTSKDLVEGRPADWCAYVDVKSTGKVDLVDADLSTVMAEADKVLRIDAPYRQLVQIEFQASLDPKLGERLLRYNVLLSDRHGLPVRSIVVLLRPEADGPAMTGLVEHRIPEGTCYLEFRYQVVRAWEKPVSAVMAGGLATLPMAPLADVTAEALPAVIGRMKERIGREAAPAEAAKLWASTYLLMGLRYSRELTEQLLQGVRAMEESSTYQALLARGEAQGKATEARKILLQQGTKRLGTPDAATASALQEIGDVGQLESLIDRLDSASSWKELLAMP